MDIDANAKHLQSELACLETRLKDFEARSKKSIESDHKAILAELQKSVDVVKNTTAYLETRARLIGGEGDASAEERRSHKALVQKHVENFNAKFVALQAAAESGLDRVETIKKTCDDMHQELTAVCSKLKALKGSAEGALAKAKKTLADKQQEISNAEASLASAQQELAALEAKMEQEMGARNGMRVARVAAWSIGAVFHVALIAAAGLELVAKKLRRARKDLQAQISAATALHSSLQSEVSTAKRQTTALKATAAKAQRLWLWSESTSNDSQLMNTLICQRLEEYQALKVTTDELAAWASGIHAQAKALRVLGLRSEAQLWDATTRIIEMLQSSTYSDVQAICGKLRKPQLPSGN